jgi:citrate lyase subunit beta/citryl-CoA lyase
MMQLRSMLFVPSDSERKMAKGLQCPADALILDLEDSVAPERKPVARAMAAQFLAEHSTTAQSALFVRINPLDSGLALQDLAAVVKPGLTGIMLPKTMSAHDVVRLGYYLDALEVNADMPQGTVKIVPIATETAQAMLNMQSFTTPIARLAGITWGAEDLSAAIGAISNRDEDGQFSPLYVWAGALCLSAAAKTWLDWSLHAARHADVAIEVVLPFTRTRWPSSTKPTARPSKSLPMPGASWMHLHRALVSAP